MKRAASPASPARTSNNQPPALAKRTRQAKTAQPAHRHVDLEYGRLYQLTYSDANGEVSERTIKLNGVASRRHGQCLEAYCHNARQQRTFRVDRIVQLIDTETGEIVL
ncbi:hypothetical protein GCM10007935_10490 [Hydrogenophaga electricum]|uniref:WYL domain-containing protein n=1 Tax=Hydrogenophaga electricum TaxID=1230953 RepID=A0ABQ6C3P9_9BURK|nr:hypothetical protein GCM10007935_10490 [Hydrogenophaga electricum]